MLGPELYWELPSGVRGPDNAFLFLVGQSSEWLQEPACHLRTGRGLYGGEPNDNAELLAGRFAILERLDYALVVRIDSLDLAKVLAHAEGDEAGVFVSGELAGDALLYEVESGSFLGGFPFVVRNKDTVEVDGLTSSALMIDLTEEFRWAIQKAIRVQWPGSTPPA